MNRKIRYIRYLSGKVDPDTGLKITLEYGFFGNLYFPDNSKYSDDQILDVFPKEKKRAYLNYILICCDDTNVRAQLLYIYTKDIIGERWEEAEPHIMQFDIARIAYSQDFLENLEIVTKEDLAKFRAGESIPVNKCSTYFK